MTKYDLLRQRESLIGSYPVYFRFKTAAIGWN